MASNAVPGFLPSRHGLRFANHWGSGPARQWNLGMLHIGIGNTGRGLCGGMAFAGPGPLRARRRRRRPRAPPPAAGTPLFQEIVDRQFDSFGRFWTVPLRFWLPRRWTSDRRRLRETVRVAWPRVRADIDAGRLSTLGLVRHAGWNPLSTRHGPPGARLSLRRDAEAHRHRRLRPEPPGQGRRRDPDWSGGTEARFASPSRPARTASRCSTCPTCRPGTSLRTRRPVPDAPPANP